MKRWMCSCGRPWKERRHVNAMKREVGNNLWRGSPALLIPYRQWVREKLPNGNQGFVCCGDDGFLRGGFNPSDPRDIGEVVAVEWKSFGRQMDNATDRALAAINTGRIRGTLFIALDGGNVPGALSHYPVPKEIAEDDDPLPEQPVVAERILVTDYFGLRGQVVTEAQLVAVMKNAAGYIDPRTVSAYSGTDYDAYEVAALGEGGDGLGQAR